MCRWLSGKLINDNQRTSLSWRAHYVYKHCPIT
nr:MAG TPA_asm: CpcT-type phycobiliprotein (PBP) lyase [Caudoviricetes sp.]